MGVLCAGGASDNFIDAVLSKRRELRAGAVQVKATAAPRGSDGSWGLQISCDRA